MRRRRTAVEREPCKRRHRREPDALVGIRERTDRGGLGVRGADTEVAQYQTKQTGGKLRFAGNYGPEVLYGIAVPKGGFATAIKDALQKLYSDGTFKKILDKYGIGSGILQAPGINGATS